MLVLPSDEDLRMVFAVDGPYVGPWMVHIQLLRPRIVVASLIAADMKLPVDDVVGADALLPRRIVLLLQRPQNSQLLRLQLRSGPHDDEDTAGLAVAAAAGSLDLMIELKMSC